MAGASTTLESPSEEQDSHWAKDESEEVPLGSEVAKCKGWLVYKQESWGLT